MRGISCRGGHFIFFTVLPSQACSYISISHSIYFVFFWYQARLFAVKNCAKNIFCENGKQTKKNSENRYQVVPIFFLELYWRFSDNVLYLLYLILSYDYRGTLEKSDFFNLMDFYMFFGFMTEIWPKFWVKKLTFNIQICAMKKSTRSRKGPFWGFSQENSRKNVHFLAFFGFWCYKSTVRLNILGFNHKNM